MKKALAGITNVVGVATLVMIGFAVLTSVGDIKRYIRISTM